MSIRQLYDAQVRAGHIARDAAQEMVLARLDALCAQLHGYVPGRKAGALGWMFAARARHPALRGLYIWGGVGRGKSMLMDMFFDAVDLGKKRRVHFHAFMAEVHAGIYKHRQSFRQGLVKGEDPIEPVAEGIARDATLLCFDEFTITDIADAMILGRLFKALFARGVIVVATSNIAPANLYADGLNRSLFLPSIALMEEHMDVVELDAPTDFRMQKLAGSETLRVPADAAARAALTAAFKALTGHETGGPATLTVLGRKVPVPQSRGNVARFSFADLCERPLGAGDYLAIARRYQCVFIDAVPVLKASQRNEAKRFIILIDAFYEAHVKLFASAAAPPDRLFEAEDGREAFEFQRTISRLNEMQSADYMTLQHGHGATMGSGMEGIVDT